MVLFSIEYEVSNGMTYICKVIGSNENDVVNNLISQVGNIRIFSLFRFSEVHRITDTVRKGIVERSLMNEPSKDKGRPRKLDL